jgi:AbrB family looped-hinge helix DNA binding protein
MTTTVTIKGQVTIPKDVREAAGIAPGDKVDVRLTSAGGIVIEKPGAMSAYRAKLEELSKRRLIRGITTNEIMESSRGESAALPQKKKKR